MRGLSNLNLKQAQRALGCVGPLLVAALAVGCSGHRPAWELPPPAVQQAPIVQPGALTRQSLENGLTIVVLEDHRLPQASLGLTVRRGAGAVPRSQAGLAELTAEVMNRGAGDLDALGLARAVDSIGASLGVSSGWDTMDVNVSGLSRDLDALLEILSDVVLAPRLEKDEIEKARSEHLAALEAAHDSPATLARWHAAAALYGEHRYGLPQSGSAETVAALDGGAIGALHAKWFVPENAILYVSGDVDPAFFLDRARALFGAWERGHEIGNTPPPPVPAPVSTRIVIADDPDLVQARIILCHDGLARTDDRRIAASLVNGTLGGSGFSSRLMKILRSDQGLTYGVGSGFALRRQPGPFAISTFTRVAETRRAVDILLAELEAIRGDRPQTDEELSKAKSFNVGQFGLGLETSAAVMGSLVDLDVYGLPEDSLDSYRERVGAVTLDQAHAIAHELLHPDRLVIFLLGPAELLGPQFEDLGEIEIVEP
jgi:zinc protease